MSYVEALNSLFDECRVLDTENNWFYLNRIWLKHSSRSEFNLLFAKFWKERVTAPKGSLVIVPEGASSSFGILPLATLLAHENECSIIIWKEFADILTTEAHLFPAKQFLTSQDLDYKECILIQDVINRGTTLVKMRKSLNDLNLRVHKYVGVVQFLEDRENLESNLNGLGSVLKDGFNSNNDVVVMATADKDNKLGEPLSDLALAE